MLGAGCLISLAVLMGYDAGLAFELSKQGFREVKQSLLGQQLICARILGLLIPSLGFFPGRQLPSRESVKEAVPLLWGSLCAHVSPGRGMERGRIPDHGLPTPGPRRGRLLLWGGQIRG